MECDFREAIGGTPYHRRHDGLSASEVFEMELLAAFLNDLITRADNLPPGCAKDFLMLVVLLLFQAMLLVGSVERRNLVPVNRAIKNRMIDSFTDEECWHNLRFRKPVFRIRAVFQFYFHAFRVENFEKKEEFRMLIFLHQKYEIELRNLFRIFEKNRNRKRSI